MLPLDPGGGMSKTARKENVSSYGADFVAGIDPFGSATGRYGQRAQKAKISEKEHRRKQAISAAGGVAGGALVVPSVVSALSSGVRGLSSGKGIGGKLREAVKGAVQGAQKPIKDIYRGTKTGKLIRKASKGKKITTVSSGEAKNLRYVGRMVPLGAVEEMLYRQSKKKNKNRSVSRKDAKNLLKRLRKARKGEITISRREARAIQPALEGKINQGYTQVALGGLVGGGGAAVQYAKGRSAEKDFERRLKEKRAAELTTRGRDQIKSENFALPGRRYPIHDASHARNALARVEQHGTEREKELVRAAVARKYPGIGKVKQAATSMYGGLSDDPDVAPTEKYLDVKALNRADCIRCGSPMDKDDLRCPKCGARQVARKAIPETLASKAQRRADAERLQKENLEEGTGGEEASAYVDQFQKNAFIVGKPQGITGSILEKVDPKHHKKVTRAIGATTLVGSAALARKLNQLLYGGKKAAEGAPSGMVRTASEKKKERPPRRRTINPAYNFKAGKKKRTIREALSACRR